ncbi:MAG: hypothetical protein JXK08_04705 [Flavobacteriaceae bacterium]|nr:hypothetical protein [Flavobacteriaceae bacterium]
MFLQKSILLPTLGVIGLMLLNLLAYLKESVFTETLLTCSFILMMIFFIKVVSETNKLNN